MKGNPMALMGAMGGIMSSPAVKDLQKKMKENPTMLSDTIGSIRTATLKVNGAIDTYLGTYDEKGEQIEKGDRDYFFEFINKILNNQENIIKNQEMILTKLEKLELFDKPQIAIENIGE